MRFKWLQVAVRTREFDRAAAKLGFRTGMVAENRTGRPERPIELAALLRQTPSQFMGFLRMAEKAVSSSRRNGGFFLSASLIEALTEVALDGVEHGGRSWCNTMCRISMLGCRALKASTSHP